MSPNVPSQDLWEVKQTQPKYVWIGCQARPAPGHARHVYPHQVEGSTCLVCLKPMKPLSKTAIEAYKAGDRRCFHCQCEHHSLCTGVGCYDCPREFHRRDV